MMPLLRQQWSEVLWNGRVGLRVLSRQPTGLEH